NPLALTFANTTTLPLALSVGEAGGALDVADTKASARANFRVVRGAGPLALTFAIPVAVTSRVESGAFSRALTNAMPPTSEGLIAHATPLTGTLTDFTFDFFGAEARSRATSTC